ncbi:UNVERIFIED_CONTAM: putative aminophospholipid-translocase [Siphonaria sp. JEL0065]|nr:putative aminophospholipid-translocase [Siphonaria sp. JEL0065]
MFRRRSNSPIELVTISSASPAPSNDSKTRRTRTASIRQKKSNTNLGLFRTVREAFGRQKVAKAARTIVLNKGVFARMISYTYGHFNLGLYSLLGFCYEFEAVFSSGLMPSGSCCCTVHVAVKFKFFFNLYFLLIALSQFIPALKIGLLFSYVAPLAFVLLVTLGREAADDWERMKRDAEANSTMYKRLSGLFDDADFDDADLTVRDLEDGDDDDIVDEEDADLNEEWVKSSELVVGDFVVIEKDQRVGVLIARRIDKRALQAECTSLLDNEQSELRATCTKETIERSSNDLTDCTMRTWPSYRVSQ